MHKRKLWKSIRKSITHSMGRFISIMLLMALGSFALVGLTVTGPDMRATGTTYFKELNSADLTILSDYGIDESERNAIEKASGIRQVEYLYLKDVVIKDTQTTVRILSKPSEISKYRIDEGNLPEQDDEIAIDRTYKDKYKIGDTISFTEKANTEGNETLKRHDYKITGFISSSEIISEINMGQTSAGTGELKGYAVVNSDNFDSSVYMMAKLTFTDTENLDPYSDEYNDKLQAHKEELTKLLDEQRNNRFSAIKSEYQEKIDDGQKELDDGRTELNDAKEKLEKLDAPTYSVDNRREIPGGDGYSVYETVSEIVDSLAKVFPVFLYFVAALVTFTTMTRFVSEERINNGTLKSLGYQDKDVIQKFVVYGFIAGMTGTVLGITLGHTLLPHIVYNAYKHGFLLPPIELHFYVGITILAIILSLISSVLPAYAVAKGDLQETTASLLQPKAPKAGSKILLERITPIWKRMKFTQKVTARNIFRYKNRMFMTIFGVAGAASILFAGFSVKGSISKINEKQFENIIKYDMIVVQNDDLDEEAKTEFNNLLNSEEIKSYSSVYYEEVTKVAGKNNDTQSIKLIIPENDEDFNQYISLADRKSQEKIELQDDGIVISERLSKLLNISKGDEITFTDSSNKERTAKVSGICEMYAGHFIFMNTTEYKNAYQKDCESNAKLLLLNDSSTENTNSQAAKFMELSAVKGIVQNTTLYNQINTIVNSLNQIMIVLIIVASMLAVVILYNLTNINVAERIRELCTIKVLGFYDNEVTMYIYKETIFLSIIGVIVGWIIGILLHTYILVAVPPAEVMFDPKVTISSYIVPAVVIAFVTFVLKYYVNNRLKVVDMLEALKSVD